VLFWSSPAIDVGNGRRFRQVQQVSRRLCPAARDGIQMSVRRSATEFRRARRSAISNDAANPDPQADSVASGQAAESLEESTGRPEGERGSPPVMALPRHIDVALRSFGQPNSVARQYDFWNDSYEWRRVFAELVGTFLLVLAAVGGGMVNARFGGHAISGAALVVAPALMVMAVILFMGGVSGAHLNPAVSVAFALRGDFPWKRVPAYVVAQVAGGVAATLLLWALVGRHGAAGLTLPGPGISTVTAMIWEAVLTAGLVSVILGTASGAQQLGPIAAIGVGSYIALAGLFGAPVSGASMNPARSLAPALVLGNWTSWWAYLAGPVLGAVIAVGIAYVLRGAGGGTFGTRAAQGTLGTLWIPGRAGPPASGAAPRS
jgi:aquaporin Z